MKVVFRALWTLLTQLFLGLIGQPVPGPSAPERAQYGRKKGRVEAETGRAGPLAVLKAVTREAFLGLIGQPSPGEPRSAASRRRPRS